jgi:hypothetical protein
MLAELAELPWLGDRRWKFLLRMAGIVGDPFMAVSANNDLADGAVFAFRTAFYRPFAGSIEIR